VQAKKVKNAAATESSRLWKRLKPSRGKPRKLPPAARGEWAVCVITFATSLV
jgi:hypothetical protein